VILKLANTIHKELKVDYLCLAGGVALNCVANGKLLNQGPFKDIWIQPAAGDSGGALGAALSVWYEYLDNTREVDGKNDKMKGSYLGGSFTNDFIEDYLKEVKASYEYIEDEELFIRLAKIINDGHVVGWFNGRMEFGPRALGARSIIGDPRSETMQSTMNLKIKYRESFRPFAPAVLFQFAQEWFEIEKESPYMLLVSNVKNNKLVDLNAIEKNFLGLDKLNTTRSLIPAVTHVDNSARVQTVHKDTNQRFFHLLSEFNKLSGCPVLINTSFNVRGEPIVYSPEDAFKCFMSTEMDFLVMENILLDKKNQGLENIKV
jgi:carbamoyltransferase